MSRDEDVRAVLDSGLFDLEWVRERWPACPAAPFEAVASFLECGPALGLDPGPGFSVRRYLRANPDVAAAGVDALLHYVRHGHGEGRACYPASDDGDDPPLADEAQCEQDIEIVGRTRLFDADFYRDSYPDVVAAGIEPLAHYIRHGAAEGRWPNPYFDSRWYRRRYQSRNDPANPLAHYAVSAASAWIPTSERFDGALYRARHADAAASALTPLEHFLRHGLDEGWIPCAAPSEGTGRLIDPREVRATVVIPVHEAATHVAACLDSVLRHGDFGGVDSLLVIDDASQDPAIRALLDALEGRPGVRVLRNQVNLGYTRTANRGCRMAAADDVLLLNSDTVVGPHWLRNLKLAAYARARTGTVTAVSDNAGAFSVPQAGANAMPAGTDVEAWSRAVADAGAPAFEVPTGNGFCLYLRRAMLDEVGIFDETAFPVGYGEENDLCMRAAEAGWHHLVVPSVFVHHARSASFGVRRDALAQAGASQLEARHPGYPIAAGGIGHLTGFVLARHRIARRFRALEAGTRPPPRQRIMYVLSTRDGGIPQANADLMRALSADFDCLALRSDRRQVEVLALGTDGYEVIEACPLSEPVGFATHVSGEYEEVVRAILVRRSIDLLHIRHLAWHSLNLADVARGLGIAVVQSFHDHYAICPTVNLVDDTGRFHPGGVTADARPALWPGDAAAAAPVNAVSLAAWQRRMQAAMAPVDAFVTTSDSSRTLLQQALPVLAGRAPDFHVIPHGRDFPEFRSLADGDAVTDGMPLRILLPGNLGLHKGAALVAELARLSLPGILEFHLLGTAVPELKPFVVDHGSYSREDFLPRVAAIRPHLAAILSLAPETWCHTLTECWAAGIPVLAIDRGALGERLRRHGGGWLLPDDPARIHAWLLALRGQPGERQARTAEVRAWQQAEGRANDAKAMAARYLELYQRLLGRHGAGPSGPLRQPTH